MSTTSTNGARAKILLTLSSEVLIGQGHLLVLSGPIPGIGDQAADDSGRKVAKI